MSRTSESLTASTGKFGIRVDGQQRRLVRAQPQEHRERREICDDRAIRTDEIAGTRLTVEAVALVAAVPVEQILAVARRRRRVLGVCGPKHETGSSREHTRGQNREDRGNSRDTRSRSRQSVAEVRHCPSPQRGCVITSIMYGSPRFTESTPRFKRGARSFADR